MIKYLLIPVCRKWYLVEKLRCLYIPVWLTLVINLKCHFFWCGRKIGFVWFTTSPQLNHYILFIMYPYDLSPLKFFFYNYFFYWYLQSPSYIHCLKRITEWINNQIFSKKCSLLCIGSSVVGHWTAGQQVERRSCTRGTIHNKIHLISLGCPQPSIALLCRIVA